MTPTPARISAAAGDTAKSSHTPGPWSLTPGDSVIEVAAYGEHIATVGSVPYWKRYNETDKANASLIASAPDMALEIERLRSINADMLAALDSAMVIIDSMMMVPEDKNLRRAFDTRRDKILAARAKARGGSQ